MSVCVFSLNVYVWLCNISFVHPVGINCNGNFMTIPLKSFKISSFSMCFERKRGEDKNDIA